MRVLSRNMKQVFMVALYNLHLEIIIQKLAIGGVNIVIGADNIVVL